ncbi:MAG: M1 family aminopeptidase, partial [Terriglobia bacterium]
MNQLCLKLAIILLSLATSAAAAADLSESSPQDLLQVYQQLRQLQGSTRTAVTENVAWQRDAATFTFRSGHLTFAAPVAGHVVAAVFDGDGNFELLPPTRIEQHQLSRFAKTANLSEDFHHAVFFFTDDSWSSLQKLLHVTSSGDPAATGKAIEAAEQKYSRSFNDWWANQQKGNLVMRNLAARMLADLSDPTSRGFFLADFKGQKHGDLLYHISWNREPLLLPMFRKDEEVMLLRYVRNGYYEWWAGYHLAAEYARDPHPDHSLRMDHCQNEEIDADISKDHKLSATARMQFEALGGAARVIPFSLAGVLRIQSVTDGAGNKLAFIQEDRELDNDPWLILPEPAIQGHSYSLEIQYQEKSDRYSRVIFQQGSGLYYVTSRESWFPSFGAFDDRTMFDLHFDSPRKFTLVGTGHQVSSRKTKDDEESEWKSEIPYSVVGFNYGDFVHKSHSDSNLTVTAYSGREVPDELLGVKNRINMGDFSQGVSGSGEGRMEAQTGIAVGGFNTASMAATTSAISFQAFRLYENYFGSLPFHNIAVTEQPVRGYGQSWPTLIFLPYDAFLDATTRHSLGLTESATAREFYNIVAVHEMSHQWWGHLVGWKTYHDQWLSEGFADFSAALYLQAFEPKEWNAFWDLQRRQLLEKDRAGQRPVDGGPLWLNYQLNQYEAPGVSTTLIYDKGAYVLEMLRMLMENSRSDQPDAAFISMMKDFVSTYAGKNASTEDFQSIVAKHMKDNMDWFFNEWVYGTEVPHYDFQYQ